MLYSNVQHVSDINKLTNKPMLSSETLNKLSKILPKRICTEIKKVKRFDYTHGFDRDTVTVEYLVKTNVRLAIRTANKYYEITGAKRTKRCDIKDLVQEVYIGLIKAANKYIETKDGEYADYGFSHYARLWCEKYAREFISNGFNPVKLTTHEGASNVLASVGMYSVDERYTMPGGDSDMVSPVFNELRTNTDFDQLSDIRNQIIRKRELLQKLLKSIDEFEYQVIDLKFGLTTGHELDESSIAKQLRKRRKTIVSTLDSALTKLRESNNIKPNELLELFELTKRIKYTDDEFKLIYGEIVDCPWEMHIDSIESELDMESIKAKQLTINEIGKFLNNTIIVDTLRQFTYQPISDVFA